MSAVLEFYVYGSFGRPVLIDVARVTHWEHLDPNGRPGLTLHMDTGRQVHVDEGRDAQRRLIAAKDALLRRALPVPATAIDSTVAKAAAAVVRQLSLPESHEALDRDLVMAVCTYVMEQAAQ